MGRHERIYLVLLVVFSVFMVSAVSVTLFVRSEPESPSRLLTALMALWLAEAFVAVATLVVRLFARERSRRLTKVADLLSLVRLPWGTLLGLDGMLEVDRGQPR